MNSALLVIGLILLVALAIAVVVLRLDSRQNRLEQRVGMIVGVGVEGDQATEPARSIRASPPRARLSRLVDVVLRIPIGLPLANVLPVWLVFAIAVMAGFAAGWGANFVLPIAFCWCVGIAAGFLLARGLFGWELERYRKKLLQQMPDAIQLVVSATRAGLPIAEAFRGLAREMPSPTREEFAQMVGEMSLGAPPEEVLMGVHRRTQVTEYAIFAVTVAVQMRSGGGLAETIQNLAETVRQRLQVAQRAQALAAEAKLSSRIISVLPFVGGGLMTVLQPGSLGPLFHEPRGKRLIAFGVVTLILGMFTMHKMIQGVTRD